MKKNDLGRAKERKFFKKIEIDERDPLLFYPVILSLAAILAQIIIISFYITTLPSKIPLFYSRSWGQDQLTNPRFLWLIPAGSLAILFLNYLLARLGGERLLPRRILLGFALFLTLSLFLTLARIVLLVS